MPYRAIVIDDDFDVVEAFTEYLKIKGIEVLAIGNDGRQAVKLYQEHSPDVVLLDAKMPKYDGFYGLEKIIQADQDAKIIVATASISHTTAQKLMNMHAKAIIYKPYDIDNVIDTINRVCSGETLPIPETTSV